MTADEILSALARKHAADVFVPECKNGPTQGQEHVRLDAWAMPRSWVNMCFYGYEIKVSRSDFLRDQKMHLYLKLCNCFSVVCPTGMIAPEELPPEAGLLWAPRVGSRLLTKRKAPYREIAPPVDLLRYVLMCRARITKDTGERGDRDRMIEVWRTRLAEKRLTRELGGAVSRGIREEIHDRVQAAEDRAAVAERELKQRVEIGALLRAAGLPDNAKIWEVRQALSGATGENDRRLVRDAHASLGRLLERLESYEEGKREALG